MAKRKKSLDELQGENVAKFMQDGPRLRRDYNTFVTARDPERKMVCLGGLGSMGVGTMWFEERPEHHNYPGYDDAPIEWAWTWEDNRRDERPDGACPFCSHVKTDEEKAADDAALIARRETILREARSSSGE